MPVQRGGRPQQQAYRVSLKILEEIEKFLLEKFWHEWGGGG